MDTLRLYFVTWNVATRSPEQDMNSLLDFPSQFNKNKPIPDFFVIGLQEVKSQPQNILMDTLFTDPWTSTFNKILCRQNYIIAKSIRLQGLLLMVYTRMCHLIHLRDIEAQYTKTGLGGIWGNKGAVSVRFNIYGCSVCFVNSHLTAHEHLLADRINDYNTIIKQHNFHVKETVNILYHDYVFWIGDLNFRTDHQHNGKTPTSEEIVANLKKIEKDKYKSILQHDQLIAVMKSEEAFSEFTEPEIRFPPTYKYFIGSDDYDAKRKPSWTDRILYKVIPNTYENITLRADLVSYNHLPHYTVSDHKPVIAQYTIKIRFTPRPVAAPPLSLSQITLRSATIASATDFVEETSVVSSKVQEVEGRKRVEEESLRNPACSGCVHVLRDKVFSDYTEKTAEFAPISRIWYIGDADFRTQCTLSGDVEIHPNDWIGIYDANFQSLDDYIAYEYLAKVKLPQSPGIPGQPRTITLSFPVGSGVRIPGFYRFIYLSQPNSDIRSVLGISEPFEVSSKEDQLLSLDSQPSCSRAPLLLSKPSTATSDLFSDFSGLDVASLSRHFSNDLSID